jgi:L-Ala-D/L-Glu epimerase
MMADLALDARIEQWPIAGEFVISRGAKSAATLVTASISAEGMIGRGECAPYARYGENAQQVREAILAAEQLLKAAPNIAEARRAINSEMPAGAARNALDCALWDLQAKLTGTPVWALTGLPSPIAVTTAFTISLGAPGDMARAAANASARPILKLKLGGNDAARIHAVREAAPAARLIVDANESWSLDTWPANLAACMAARVEMIEQPFPAGGDAALAELSRPIPVCADESAHDAPSFRELSHRYDAVNVKLDKTGGLTGAIEAVRAARALHLSIMLGCMVSTSLSMAPAMLLATQADIVDLDGPLLLARDREFGVGYDGSRAHPPAPQLWGSG